MPPQTATNNESVQGCPTSHKFRRCLTWSQLWGCSQPCQSWNHSLVHLTAPIHNPTQLPAGSTQSKTDAYQSCLHQTMASSRAKTHLANAMCQLPNGTTDARSFEPSEKWSKKLSMPCRYLTQSPANSLTTNNFYSIQNTIKSGVSHQPTNLVD